MTYEVTVPCMHVIERMGLSAWALEHGMDVLNTGWAVVNKRQHATFTFKHEGDATMFALKFS